MRNVILLLCVILQTWGCTDNPPATYPTVATIDEAKLALGPGDKLALSIFNGEKETHAAYTLDGSGSIEVQFIGTVTANGKTAAEVQTEIQKRLADGYFVNPIVSITIVEINSLTCAVFGQVAKSGSIKFRPGLTVTEAIALSGGFQPLARKNMVKVTRSENGKKSVYKIPVELIADGQRPNFPMMPGDEIFVPERPW